MTPAESRPAGAAASTRSPDVHNPGIYAQRVVADSRPSGGNGGFLQISRQKSGFAAKKVQI